MISCFFILICWILLSRFNLSISKVFDIPSKRMTKKPVLSFCVSLDRLAQKSECSAFDVQEFYESVFEFGPKFLLNNQDFSDIERDSIKQSFPSAVEKTAKFTPELLQQPKLNQLKILLSSIEFLTHNIYEIFKFFSLDDSPSNLAENITFLQEKQENIKKLLKSIKNDDCEKEKENIPNLDGIPEEHDWWTQKDRESRKIEKEKEKEKETE